MTHLYKAAVNAVCIKHSDFKFGIACIGMSVLSHPVAVDDNIGIAGVSGFPIANFIAADFIQFKELSIFALARVIPGDFHRLLASDTG